MKLENELHKTETFDLIEKKEIWSKNFETGTIAGLLYQIKNAVGWIGRKAIIFFIFLFINLETIFFTNKTIPKLLNESGNVITDHTQILQETKTYYENLYSKRDTVSNKSEKWNYIYWRSKIIWWN